MDIGGHARNVNPETTKQLSCAVALHERMQLSHSCAQRGPLDLGGFEVDQRALGMIAIVLASLLFPRRRSGA